MRDPTSMDGPDSVPPGEIAPTPPPPPASGGGSRWRASLWELVKTLVLVVVFVVTIRAFVVEAYVIHGKSMEPTFHDSERLLISKFAPRFEELHRGDIVIFNHPDEPGKRLIKRVIGLPGEEIQIVDGRVYVDGTLVDEPYLEATLRDGTHMAKVLIEADHYFVLGDNRDISNDSRRMGTVPRDAVVGKALVLFYPKLKVF
jgi:signal peptidase I